MLTIRKSPSQNPSAAGQAGQDATIEPAGTGENGSWSPPTVGPQVQTREPLSSTGSKTGRPLYML